MVGSVTRTVVVIEVTIEAEVAGELFTSSTFGGVSYLISNKT